MNRNSYQYIMTELRYSATKAIAEKTLELRDKQNSIDDMEELDGIESSFIKEIIDYTINKIINYTPVE